MVAPVSVVVVLAMLVIEAKFEVVDFSHLTTEPVSPLKVKFAGVVPLQMVWSAEIDPPTVVGLTFKITFCVKLF
jgi:hypothetical protein